MVDGLVIKMISDRLYTPAPNELIYHYCGSATFVEIMRSRTMWASSYFSMNDSTERQWGYSIFTKAANIAEEVVGKEFADQVRTIVSSGDLISMAMISSYSLDPDTLSQWRAYADNGTGFAIGFSRSEMNVPAAALRVLYDEEVQLNEMISMFKTIYEQEKALGFKYDDIFKVMCASICYDVFAFKNPAFMEEKEIRLVHMSLLLASSDKAKRILPRGELSPDYA